jgi:hypothetical protein
MEPVADLRRRADGAGLAHENEERCLESVMGVGVIAEDAAARPEDIAP